MNRTLRSTVSIKVITLILSMSVALFSFSNHEEPASHDTHDEAAHTSEASSAHGHGEEHKEEGMMDIINHHIGDAHEIEIYHNSGGTEIVMPLPVVLFSSQKGLTFAMSNEFDHGHKAINGYKLTHHGIENEAGDHPVNLVSAFSSHGGERYYDLSITKNVFSMLLSVLILLAFFIPTAKKYNKGVAPKGTQNLLEVLIIFVRDEIVKPNMGDKTAKFLPFLLTVFFFIWVNNILGVIPFFPGSANLTGNIAFTMVMAVIILIVTNVNGTKDYWGHILWMPGVPWPLKPMLALIELVGVLTKPFALMIRLFANITAGHIIILALALSLGLASGPLVLFMDVLELLVAFLQAYVFTMLASLFIGQAVEEHEHH